MFFNRKFLFVFVGVTFAILWYCDVNAGIWQMESQVQQSEKPDIQDAFENTVNSSEQIGEKKTLCPAGQYVSQCGNYRVGFYWLKTAKLPYKNSTETETPNGTEDYEHMMIETRNYYVGETNVELFDQMRIFFSGIGDISMFYKDTDGVIQPISYATFVNDRELILKNVCHPNLLASIKCEKCPNNATVEESSVELDEDNLAVAGSWRFHTIADCYVTEFKDSTGTYLYIPDDTPNISDAIAGINKENSEHCYYTNTTPSEYLNGDEIGTVVPGTISSITDFENPDY